MIDNSPLKTIYSPCPLKGLKRVRRSNSDITTLLEEVLKITDNEPSRITIRHLFYRLVSVKAIEKTEEEYKNLCNQLTKWRRSGELNWDCFSDSTRRRLGITTFDSIGEALQDVVSSYKRNLWKTQNDYVECWVEKDAISSMVASVANQYGVITNVCRGFASLTSLYDISNKFKGLKEQGKEIYVYYFGDHDPSGKAIDEAIKNTLRDDFDVNINFQRAAILPEQIELYNLPTRPGKATDRRAKDWIGNCVEVDALTPATLKGLVEDCITKHIDGDKWDKLKAIEREEKEQLQQIIQASRN